MKAPISQTTVRDQSVPTVIAQLPAGRRAKGGAGRDEKNGAARLEQPVSNVFDFDEVGHTPCLSLSSSFSLPHHDLLCKS